MKALEHLKTIRELPLVKDARNFQIIFLSSFLLYGIWSLNWDLDVYRYSILISTCLVVQIIGIFIFKIPAHSLKSALITGLGLSLLFRADSSLTLFLGAFIAIAGKFILRVNNKHIFNPANLGIVLSILLFGDAWISPGQWGSSAVLLFFIGSCGMMVLFKSGRIDTGLAFLGTLFLLEYLRNKIFLGWDYDFLLHKFSNGSLLLFAFFMITDPITTPNHRISRLIWAMMVAVCAFLLGNWYQVHTAPLWALFFISPFTPLFDKILVGKRFDWINARVN